MPNKTESDPSTLLLVDGSSYLYRAYHALPDLRGPDGFPVGAIHGMVGMMRKLRQDVPCEHAACVFDAKGKTFRDDWYADYKATRKTMPDDLALQIDPIHEVVKLLGWPVLEVPGVEADDVIGTLACAAAKGGHKVVVSTGDKDLAQLVTPRITLINTMSNEMLDVDGVIAKFGVPPERIVDYLTLIGDSVDNIPGVDKVGPKTAAKWIIEHGSLEGVIANAGSVKGVAGDNLRKALDWLPQGRRLITVMTDCDLSGHVMDWPEFESLALRDADREALLAFYDRYGFKSLKRELEAQMRADAAIAGADMAGHVQAPPAPPLERHYDTILTPDALDAWVKKAEAAPITAIDTETDSLDPMAARIVGISLAVGPGSAAYIPLHHSYAGAPDQLPMDHVLSRLKPWLENAAAPKVGQNVKYDLQVLANAGVTVRGYVHDTMLQSYVFEAHRPHGLDSLAQRHLGRKGLSYEDVCGKGASQIPFAQVEVGRATEYSGEDCELTLHVHEVLWSKLSAEPQLLHVYRDIEMPVAHVLQRVERNGVLIDAAVLNAQSRELGERMMGLERQAHELAGQPFNIGSPKQIGDVLYTKLAMPVLKRTASGAPSTDEDVLEKLAEDYPLPAKILEHRSLAKLKGTYTDKLPLMVNPATGRVHTNYAQAVAVTGRLSSNEPNLQNIPIRTVEGRRVREAFIAPPGHVVMSADYSQIELRLMAHISEDTNLVRAFTEGMDVHRATAAEVFGVDPLQVTAEQRRYAKTINFGLIYGMSAFGLASNLGIERSAATSYIERYFARYPAVKRYMDETKAMARTKGYVQTMFGRRVWLPEINSPNGPRRSGAERQAINAPMQGTAADIIKLAMLAVQKAFDDGGRAAKMVLQVHDELVFEVPESEVAWAREEIPRIMASVVELKVPLVADVGVGRNWDEAH
jgi:DNA polymerase-1